MQRAILAVPRGPRSRGREEAPGLYLIFCRGKVMAASAVGPTGEPGSVHRSTGRASADTLSTRASDSPGPGTRLLLICVLWVTYSVLREIYFIWSPLPVVPL